MNEIIKFKNNNTGIEIDCPTGFSWTSFLFGFFVPFFRNWYIEAAIWLVAAIFTSGLSWLVHPFIINKNYAKFLLKEGYTPVGPEDVESLKTLNVNWEGQRGNGVSTNTQNGNDALEQIEKLGELKEKGLITEEEFNEKKKNLLAA